MPFDKAQIRAANYHVEHEEEEGLFCVDEDWDRIQGLVIQPAPIITPAAGAGTPHVAFQPPSYNALFGNILKNVSIRKRPPVSYCDMCVGSPALRLEVNLLDSMTCLDEEREQEEEDFPEWHWGQYKTRENAMARLKKCKRLLEARNQHKIWVASQRIAVSPPVLNGIDTSGLGQD